MTHVLIDMKVVSCRNRIQQKGIVCQKEKYPVSCGRLREGENEEKPMTRELGSDQGWGRRKSLKGRFRANGYAKRKPAQSRLRADQQSQFTSGICEKSSSSRAGNWEENASEEKRGSERECALGSALA